MNTEDMKRSFKTELDEAAYILKNGGLVAFPTETVYGLGANGLDKEAAKKIYEAKGRPSDNPLILHLYSPLDAEKYARTCTLYYKLVLAFMPGPLTVVLPKKSIVPNEVTGGLKTVALRVPAHPMARELLKRCDFPVAAPSANLSGRPSPTTKQHVVDDLSGRVDMILDGGECEIGLESTIVSVDGDSLTLLRPGAITPEMLAPLCSNFKIDPSLDHPLAGDQKPLAPGMKYKHYAPKANVILLDGTTEAIEEFLLDKIADETVGFMVDDQLFRVIHTKNTIYYGKNPMEEAHALFSCLRTFDKHKKIKTIYAPLPKKEGIGLAVYNRLVKAAGFTILKI